MAETVYLRGLWDILRIKGGLTMPKTFWEFVRENKGDNVYVMRNEQHNIEVECTQSFIKYWEERGFRVKEEDGSNLKH